MKLVSLGVGKLSEEKFMPVKISADTFWQNKPKGGLWSSPYRERNDENPYISAWHEWVNYKEYRLDKYATYTTFELIPEARIYTINTTDDYIKLITKYELESLNTGRHRERSAIHFEKLAKDYDALYVTEDAAYRLHSPMDDIWFYQYRDLYSWYVESVLVLNFKAIDLHTMECHRLNAI